MVRFLKFRVISWRRHDKGIKRAKGSWCVPHSHGSKDLVIDAGNRFLIVTNEGWKPSYYVLWSCLYGVSLNGFFSQVGRADPMLVRNNCTRHATEVTLCRGKNRASNTNRDPGQKIHWSVRLIELSVLNGDPEEPYVVNFQQISFLILISRTIDEGTVWPFNFTPVCV